MVTLILKHGNTYNDTKIADDIFSLINKHENLYTLPGDTSIIEEMPDIFTDYDSTSTRIVNVEHERYRESQPMDYGKKVDTIKFNNSRNKLGVILEECKRPGAVTEVKIKYPGAVVEFTASIVEPVKGELIFYSNDRQMEIHLKEAEINRLELIQSEIPGVQKTINNKNNEQNINRLGVWAKQLNGLVSLGIIVTAEYISNTSKTVVE